jgi:hypothetical protein
MGKRKRPDLAFEKYGRAVVRRLVGFNPASLLDQRALRAEVRKCREAHEGGNAVALSEALLHCLCADEHRRRRRRLALKPSDLVRVPRWALEAALELSNVEVSRRRGKVERYRADAYRFIVVEELRELRGLLGRKWGRGQAWAHPEDQRKLNSRLPAAGTLFERAETYLEGTLGAGTAKQIERSWRRVYSQLKTHSGRPGPYRMPYFGDRASLAPKILKRRKIT